MISWSYEKYIHTLCKNKCTTSNHFWSLKLDNYEKKNYLKKMINKHHKNYISNILWEPLDTRFVCSRDDEGTCLEWVWLTVRGPVGGNRVTWSKLTLFCKRIWSSGWIIPFLFNRLTSVLEWGSPLGLRWAWRFVSLCTYGKVSARRRALFWSYLAFK